MLRERSEIIGKEGYLLVLFLYIMESFIKLAGLLKMEGRKCQKKKYYQI
jgi:hypothetical protein